MRKRRYAWLTAGVLYALTGLLPADAAGANSPVRPAPPPTTTRTTGTAPAPDPADPKAPEPAPAGPEVPAVARTWPVGERPAILRGWNPPATPYGPGHRGVDLASPPGTPVRAVAPGRVSFAGRVAGRGVVTVELTGTGTPPLRTTYEPVRPSVEKGTEVAAGDILGTLDTPSHCGGHTCLHWGLRRGAAYLNPLSLLPPWLTDNAPPRLLPVLGVPLPE
ncbi:M23 family metallopeptidase [Streptomyces sp. NPDC005925]|uniref:murein hydrolase activator EnvC family protein n=1 Tax=Streptomyces sp. NPDC005925 TaxID=3157172 RepID=UPI0033DDD136